MSLLLLLVRVITLISVSVWYKQDCLFLSACIQTNINEGQLGWLQAAWKGQAKKE